MKIKKLIRSGLKAVAAVGAGYTGFELLKLAVGTPIIPAPLLIPIAGIFGATLMLGTQTFSDFMDGAGLQRQFEEEA